MSRRTFVCCYSGPFLLFVFLFLSVFFFSCLFLFFVCVLGFCNTAFGLCFVLFCPATRTMCRFALFRPAVPQQKPQQKRARVRMVRPPPVHLASGLTLTQVPVQLDSLHASGVVSFFLFLRFAWFTRARARVCVFSACVCVFSVSHGCAHFGNVRVPIFLRHDSPIVILCSSPHV